MLKEAEDLLHIHQILHKEVGISFQWLPKLYALNIHKLISRTGQPRSLLELFQSTLGTWNAPEDVPLFL
jgi:hypothetical protein